MSDKSSAKSIALAFAAGAATGAVLLARMTRQPKQDPAKKAEQHLWKVAEYSLTGGLIRVCDKLKLYDALWESGPSTAAELAAKLNCNERWLTEILSQATAAGICVYFFGKFCLKPEYAHLLRDPSKAPRSMQGLFDMVPVLLDRTDATVQAVKTGSGVDYDFQDGAIEVAIDRKNANWFKNKLEEDILKKVKAPKTEKSLVDMLEEGIHVADIGVGFGASTIALAQRFPKSHFCAFESSAKSLLKKYGIAYLATSIPLAIVSFAICYVLVDNGVDMTSLLGKIGIESSNMADKAGTFAIAYAAHKALSPVRFPPTVLLTPVVAKLIGKEPEAAEEEAP